MIRLNITDLLVGVALGRAKPGSRGDTSTLRSRDHDVPSFAQAEDLEEQRASLSIDCRDIGAFHSQFQLDRDPE